MYYRLKLLHVCGFLTILCNVNALLLCTWLLLCFENASDGSMLQSLKMRFILEEEVCKVLIICKLKFTENSEEISGEKLVFWVCCRAKRETYRNGSLQWKPMICEFYACSKSQLSFSILQKWKYTSKISVIWEANVLIIFK